MQKLLTFHYWTVEKSDPMWTTGLKNSYSFENNINVISVPSLRRALVSLRRFTVSIAIHQSALYYETPYMLDKLQYIYMKKGLTHYFDFYL